MSVFDLLRRRVKRGSLLWKLMRVFVYRVFDYTEVVRYDHVLPAVVGRSVVDVGAGVGKLLWKIKEEDPRRRVVAVESDPSVYHWYSDALPVLAGDGLRLPFKSGAFDTVVSTDVLEHIPPAQRSLFISELGRISKRRVVLTFPIAHACVNKFFYGILPSFLRPEWLSEHEAYGIPSSEAVEGIFKANGLTVVRHDEAIGEFGWFVTLLQHVLCVPTPAWFSRSIRLLDVGHKTWACYRLEKSISL